MKVGFTGLGVMGGPMALNIIKGVHQLTVHDSNAEAVARLSAAGATAAASASAREVGEASEVVVTMLPEPSHVEQVVLGSNGITAGMRRGGVVIDMSTIDPQTSQRVGAELRKLGLDRVDSPLGKTSEHAASGTLTLMIGGEPEVIKRVKPVLDCMGSDSYYCGGPGMGHTMKITNNLLATTIMVANTEVLEIGIKCGPMLELMLEVMSTTMARNEQHFVGHSYPSHRRAHMQRKRHPADAYINSETGAQDSAARGHTEGKMAREVGMPGGYDVGPQRISWLGQLTRNKSSKSLICE